MRIFHTNAPQSGKRFGGRPEPVFIRVQQDRIRRRRREQMGGKFGYVRDPGARFWAIRVKKVFRRHGLGYLLGTSGHGQIRPEQRNSPREELKFSNVFIRNSYMKSGLPFAALRTFEAVVRLRGFARAAEELGVTQSAVSQHVKSVEEWLGQRLILRKPGGAEPTREGDKLATTVAESFGNLATVCHEIRDAARPNLSIGLSCLPGFAYLWLIPRLINFDLRYPQYQVSIIASPQPTDFLRDDADIAIRYGAGNYPGLHVEPLLSENLFPVCAPSLLEQTPLDTVADLANHTLLLDDLGQSEGTPPTWEYWADQVGHPLPTPERALRFGQSNMVIQAAVRGFGVALGREPLVIDDLESERLVRPLPQIVPSKYAYWIVCPKAAIGSERITAIRDWLHEEALRQTKVGGSDALGAVDLETHFSNRAKSLDNPKHKTK